MKMLNQIYQTGILTRLFSAGVFMLGFCLCTLLAFPLNGLPVYSVDLSATSFPMPKWPSLSETEFTGFTISTDGPLSIYDVTPKKWKHRTNPDGQSKGRYFVPLQPSGQRSASNEPLVVFRTSSYGDAAKELTEQGTVRGWLRPEFAWMIIRPSRDEMNAISQLRAQSGRQVLILSQPISDRVSPWVVLFFLGMLIMLTHGIYTRVSCRFKPLYWIAAGTAATGSVCIWMTMFWGGPWWGIASAITSIGLAGLCMSMFWGGVVACTAHWFKPSTPDRFDFDHPTEKNEHSFDISESEIRLQNESGELVIQDQDVLRVTSLHIITSVTQQKTLGRYATLLLHRTDSGETTTELSDWFQSENSNYQVDLDRLSEYRKRVADRRAAELADTLRRTGQCDAGDWMIDRETIRWTLRGGKQQSIPRSQFLDCRFVGVEFSIDHQGSAIPLKVPSHTPDLPVFANVLASLVTEESRSVFANRPEGRVLARFTSKRFLPGSFHLPLQAYGVIGFALGIGPLIAIQWIARHHPDPIHGVSPQLWFSACIMLMAFGIVGIRRWNTWHLDLCENGLRLVKRKQERLISWESIASGNFEKQPLLKNGMHHATFYRVQLELKTPPHERIGFAWTSNLIGCGEIASLDRFMSLLSDHPSE